MTIDITEFETWLKERNLRSYQRDMLLALVEGLNRESRPLLVDMPYGSGKLQAAYRLTEYLVSRGHVNKVLFLTSARALANQMISNLSALFPASRLGCVQGPVTITTYRDFEKNCASVSSFDLCLCTESFSIPEAALAILADKASSVPVVFLSAGNQELSRRVGPPVYRLGFRDFLDGGYLSPPGMERDLREFCQTLLTSYGFEDIRFEQPYRGLSSTARPDIVARAGERTVYIELKQYSDAHIDRLVMMRAVEQMAFYREIISGRFPGQKDDYCLFLFCLADESVKQSAHERGIGVFDVSNLLYFCKDDSRLTQSLASLLQFSIDGVEAGPPFHQEIFPPPQGVEDNSDDSAEGLLLMEELRQCPTGKESGADKRYQSICEKIVDYLFGAKFKFTQSQKRTTDGLFQMDLICSLKTGTVFWDFFAQFFRSRFLVFEFKNYAEPLGQNEIVITEKYLFDAALRNVAIMISRKGFDESAEKVSASCLIENHKLIIGLTDRDLELMILKKMDGEEPADYLLERIERRLASIGKF